ELGAYKVNTTVSIGIAVYPDAGQDSKNLIKTADIAMYRSKEHGRNRYEFYTAEESQKHQKRLTIETSLGAAIKNDQLTLYYQPVFRLSDRRLIGVEALVRWHHPEYGLVLPDDFIGIAEEIGFINELDKWVISTAAHQYQQWASQGIVLENLMINIASYERDYMQRILTIMKKNNVPPSAVLFEITERNLMEEYAGFSEFLEDLQQHGFGMAIDDFGAGYSSLSRLRTMPVKALKIDQSFVQAIKVETSSELIIQSIVALAKSLQLNVIAEGIETKEQLTFLIENGCLSGQGFYLAKPMPAEQLVAFVKDAQ
ncbi:MAG: EAL domain-containing protein, partial [Coxiellaceae bacterium]|nr:EAL domain-containing protein [Coxiellaceae bacterium]